MEKRLWVVVFMSTDGHACSEVVVATSQEEAEAQVEDLDNEDVEVDECYTISDDLIRQVKA